MVENVSSNALALSLFQATGGIGLDISGNAIESCFSNYLTGCAGVAISGNYELNGNYLAVTGSAGDNFAVAAVYYSLNGGLWTNASTANNWTNWTGSLALTPGTNTIQAYAEDTSGNLSLTNTVMFVYVVPRPLQVSINGKGAMTPNDNGALLLVNENYMMTANAAAGFVFTNWTDGSGNLLTNKATLRFTMATNLAVTANFVDVQKPTLALLTPTANLQWTNGIFTATGHAGDNVAVGSVYYSLNGGVWTNASTTNSWTNWTASLTLNPGTNTLQAYAVDTSGNASITNTVRFEFIVFMPLSVRIFGLGVPNPKWGFVSPNDNGALLLVNENYTMTANAAAGFVFTNWTDGSGNLLTNKATLRFTMATNLAVTANFVDVQKPTLTLLTPTANLQWTNGTFTATGHAGDNAAVAAVYYSLNGGVWTNASTTNGWINWTGSLALTPGTNTIQAYAVDTSGNLSPTNTVKFVYVVPRPLKVSINGQGSVTPNDNGALLLVNENYMMTANAAAGFVFTNWTDGSGNLLTNKATLRFTMATNLAVTANFVDVQKPTVSILSPTANLQWTNGTFTATGHAGDNVAVGSVYYSLNGGVWTNASTTNSWTNWTASLTLNPSTNTLQAYAADISGNVSPTNTLRFEYVPPIVAAVATSAVEPVIATPVSATLAPASFANGQFALTVTGETNVQSVVQASTNLVDWVSVQTNTAPFTYVDTDAGQFKQRYYRTMYIQ